MDHGDNHPQQKSGEFIGEDSGCCFDGRMIARARAFADCGSDSVGRSGVWFERFADALHDFQIIGEIVDRVERGGERFVGLHEMAQVGA